MNLLTILASFLGINFAMFGSSGCGRGGCIITSNEYETSGQEVGIGNTTLGNTVIAQSFYVTSNTNLKSISLKLAKVGTFTTNSGYLITVAVYSNLAGAPGTQLTSSVTLSVDNITSTAATQIFTPTTYAITTGTYWIVISANYPLSGTNYIKATAHEGATNEYTQGQAIYLDGTNNWSTVQLGAFRDLFFIVDCQN
jgi:hypothetical protein